MKKLRLKVLCKKCSHAWYPRKIVTFISRCPSCKRSNEYKDSFINLTESGRD